MVCEVKSPHLYVHGGVHVCEREYLYIYVFKIVCGRWRIMHVGTCLCVCMYGGQRWTSSVSLNCSLLSFLRQGVSLNIKFTTLARLARQQAPDNFLPLPPRSPRHYRHAFCLGAGNKRRSSCLCGRYFIN